MFESEVLATWRTQLEAMALTHNTNANVYFSNACAYWKEDNTWRAAQGLALTAKPAHLPVCSVTTDGDGYPALVWAESTAVCPDLPAAAVLPSGVAEIGGLFSDNSGRRYCGPLDTMPAGAEVTKDGVVYVKFILQTAFGPAKWYQPKI
jgi:hypothetical protein